MKSKLTIINEICGILASLVVIGTFFWGYVNRIFESISISTERILDVKDTYVRAFDLLISGKIDDAEKAFRDVSKQYPTYKSTEEILKLFEDSRKKYKEPKAIRMYILRKILEEELVVPSHRQYNEIRRIVEGGLY